jgi:hypothetical protein
VSLPASVDGAQVVHSVWAPASNATIRIPTEGSGKNAIHHYDNPHIENSSLLAIY